MAIQSVKFRAGIDTEATPALLEAAWAQCEKIRFRNGIYAEKLGGWTSFASGMSGVPLKIHVWDDLLGNKLMAVGTSTNLYIVNSSGTVRDITPFMVEVNVSPNVTASAGSGVATIVDASHGLTTGSTVWVSSNLFGPFGIIDGPYTITVVDANSYSINIPVLANTTNGGVLPTYTTAIGTSTVTISATNIGAILAVNSIIDVNTAVVVGGFTIYGDYIVKTSNGTNQITIQVPTLATSSASATENGGLVNIQRYHALSGSTQTLSVSGWCLDNFGENLICTPLVPLTTGGSVGGYMVWSPSSPTNSVAMSVPNQARNIQYVFSSSSTQQVIAFSSYLRSSAAATVLWTDVGSYINWTASASNQAGSFPLPNTNSIVCGASFPQQNLIFTDTGLYSMNYVGYPNVYGFTLIATECGILGPNAFDHVNGAAYWISRGRVCRLGPSGVETVKCSVWGYMFQDLDVAHLGSIVLGSHSQFDELFVFFPSKTDAAGKNTRYIKLYEPSNGDVWDYGTMDRQCWTDQSALGNAFGGASNGTVYQHETGYDDGGNAMTWFIESGWTMISEGDLLTYIDQWWPDAKWGYSGNANQGALISITITATESPSPTGAQETMVAGPIVVSSASNHFEAEVRGRLVKFRFGDNNSGTWSRLGNMRFQAKDAGKR
jgi:hypothetical protein